MRPGPLFLNNRYHDPTLGTFISVDPLVSKTGEPYIYASGNPTTLSDPTGLDPDTSSWVRERRREIVGAWLYRSAYGSDGKGMLGEEMGTARSNAYLRLAQDRNYNQLASIGADLMDAGAPAWVALEVYNHPDGYLNRLSPLGQAMSGGETHEWVRQSWSALIQSNLTAAAAAGLGYGAIGARGATAPTLASADDLVGTSLARQLGLEGEAAAGIVKNTRRIPSLTGSAAYRIPDALSDIALTEVKNVQRLGFTPQLQDFAYYASQKRVAVQSGRSTEHGDHS